MYIDEKLLEINIFRYGFTYSQLLYQSCCANIGPKNCSRFTE